MTKVTGPGAAEMVILAAKLKAADPGLRNDLRKRLRDAAGPVVRSVQASALGMPAEHYQEGLRAEVAATVYSSVTVTKTGVHVTIVSAGRRMPAGKETLPVHMDRTRGWGHPVYARGSRGRWTWVRQHGKPGWFEAPVLGAAGRLRSACQAAVDDTMARLS